VRGHQRGRYRVGVRPGRFQARAGPEDSVAYADQVLAVGAASGGMFCRDFRSAAVVLCMPAYQDLDDALAAHGVFGQPVFQSP
jgi:hypothetical protein